MMSRYLLSSPIIIAGKAWDVQNIAYSSIAGYLLNLGVLPIAGILGVGNYLKKRSFPRLIFFFVFFYSVIAVLLPAKPILSFLGIHNFRFNTSVVYIFYAISEYELIRRLFKRRIHRCIVLLLIISASLPSVYVYWDRIKQSPYSASYLQYMPQELYSGLKHLEGKKKTVVLTSPLSSLGLAVPAISGQKVYFGRSIFTLDFKNKKAQAERFFNLEMDKREAENFLRKEEIEKVLVLFRDRQVGDFLSKYPFLSLEYQNEILTILNIHI